LTSNAAFAVHHHVALILCEDAAALEELVRELDLVRGHVQRLGARALLIPATEAEQIRLALHARGIFPRVLGQAPAGPDEQEELEIEEVEP
jgi:hypothetical protein